MVGWRRWVRAGWPVAGVGGDGHYGEYDPGKLERLRELTRELRVGEGGRGDGAGVTVPRGGAADDESDEDEEDEEGNGDDDEESATRNVTPSPPSSSRGGGAVRGGSGGVGWFDAA